MQRALKHKDPDVRIQAILRYQVLWKSRFQVWPRMEEGAHVSFKVPPPGIEFTLPSPKIGIESLPVVDPPWCPRVQTKDVEVTLNQEQHVTAFRLCRPPSNSILTFLCPAIVCYCNQDPEETAD